jgi:hypothetical protein
LYYLHLNTEADAELLATPQETIPEGDESDAVARRPVPRKPLPETANSSFDVTEQTQACREDGPVPVDSSTVLDTAPELKPLLPERRPVLPTRPEPQPNERIRRKPLGPRPLLSQSAGPNPLPGEGRTLDSHFNEDSTSPVAAASSNSESSHYDSIDRAGTPQKTFSITIIRRDPSSGAQWNVGTLVGEEQAGSYSPHSRKPYFDISIFLSTPGYGQFKSSPLTQYYDGSNGGAGKNPPGLNMLSAANHNVEKPYNHAVSGSSFVRQLCMEGSSFWTRARQHRRSESDVPGAGSVTGRPTSNSIGGARVEPSQVPVTEDPVDSEPKGYVFTSPWGGRCKFSTSTGGKSLRCRHTLPSPISANSGGELSAPSQEPTIVSELRFNLPTSTVFNAHAPSNAAKTLVIGSGRLGKQKLEHIRNKMSSEKMIRPPLPPRVPPTSYAAMYLSDEEAPPLLPPRPHLDASTTESSDDGGETHAIPAPEERVSGLPGEDESRLDLSIGQEKAGGGNRGKHAKLGKLVIYDEGFKMLDLIVAANMAVWWSVWGFDR